MWLLAVSFVTLVAAFVYSYVNRKRDPVLDVQIYQPFTLIDKKPVSHNSAVYRFALPNKDDQLGLPIGQHISIRAKINGKEVVRSYTPVGHGPGYFELLIKAYPTGNISKYISELKIGDTIDVRGPKGAFVYTVGLARHLNMVAGGTGITPMLQIIKAIVENPSDKTTVNLIFGNVSHDDILLREELVEIAEHPQVQVHHVLNEPPSQWTGGTGFITPEIMKTQLEKPSPDSKLLVCGPPPMVAAVKKAAVELGWEKARPVSRLEDQIFAF